MKDTFMTPRIPPPKMASTTRTANQTPVPIRNRYEDNSTLFDSHSHGFGFPAS